MIRLLIVYIKHYYDITHKKMDILLLLYWITHDDTHNPNEDDGGEPEEGEFFQNYDQTYSAHILHGNTYFKM